jgi:hypothetical protein
MGASVGVPLLKVFGTVRAGVVTRQDVRRYMTRERDGKVRANREVALLSNLFKTAIDYGYANENPCLGIRRIRERPRKVIPLAGELDAFLAWLRGKGKEWAVIAAMAEFAGRTGALGAASFLRRRASRSGVTRPAWGASSSAMPA